MAKTNRKDFVYIPGTDLTFDLKIGHDTLKKNTFKVEYKHVEAWENSVTFATAVDSTTGLVSFTIPGSLLKRGTYEFVAKRFANEEETSVWRGRLFEDRI